MDRPVRAWLLEWSMQPVALAECEVIELVDAPEVHRIPVGPRWCRSLLFWRQCFLPLAMPYDIPLEGHSVVVVAYQAAPRAELQHAALAVRGVPRHVHVPADADCEPPGDGMFAASQVRACFLHEGRPIVVPELRELFGQKQ
jgi:hypothetical protein